MADHLMASVHLLTRLGICRQSRRSRQYVYDTIYTTGIGFTVRLGMRSVWFSFQASYQVLAVWSALRSTLFYLGAVVRLQLDCCLISVCTEVPGKTQAMAKADSAHLDRTLAASSDYQCNQKRLFETHCVSTFGSQEEAGKDQGCFGTP